MVSDKQQLTINPDPKKRRETWIQRKEEVIKAAREMQARRLAAHKAQKQRSRMLLEVENRGAGVKSLIEETAHALFLLMQVRHILGEETIDAELVDVQARLRAKLEETNAPD